MSGVWGPPPHALQPLPALGRAATPPPRTAAAATTPTTQDDVLGHVPGTRPSAVTEAPVTTQQTPRGQDSAGTAATNAQSAQPPQPTKQTQPPQPTKRTQPPQPTKQTLPAQPTKPDQTTRPPLPVNLVTVLTGCHRAARGKNFHCQQFHLTYALYVYVL